MEHLDEVEDEDAVSDMDESEVPNMDGPQDFQTLMQEAAKLKGAQLDYKRREYVGSPKFMQETLHPEDDVLEARKEEFGARLEKAVSFKKEGNELFGGKDFEGAIKKYTRAIAVFRYFEDDGEDRPLRDFQATEEADRAQVEEHLHACLINAAACLLKLEAWEDAKHACDMAIKLHPQSVKALYRRAMCHVGLEGQGGTVHMDLAVADLRAAAKLDPANKDVRAALAKYTKQKGQQDKADRGTFGGMFGRGELYNKEDQLPQVRDENAPPIPGAVMRDGMWYAGDDGRLLI